MKAMILSAGRGERLRPLTDSTPKPLISLGEETLISRNIKLLSEAGINHIIVNLAWLGEQIKAYLQSEKNFGVNITYSEEPNGGLETAGGIITALKYIGKAPFLVINADIFTNFDFSSCHSYADKLDGKKHLAHLWLTENPPHNRQGDFSLDLEGYLTMPQSTTYTFTGIGVYHHHLFANHPAFEKVKLKKLLEEGIARKTITASLLSGLWLDVGTLERLEYAKKLCKQFNLKKK